MRCANCNHQNPPGLKFCGECGARLAVTCPACGTPNVPAQKYCGECGASLSVATSTSTPWIPSSEAGERRHLTVLFCDMVSFTELAHRLDPEVLQGVIRRYEDVCAGCITRFEGYVFQRLGDGIVAFFGYPLAHEAEAERAIHAGLEIIDNLSQLEVPDAGRLRVRIGIATGLVVVSGAQKGAVGETMNLAARLQAIAEPGSLVVSERVRKLAGGAFEYADLGEQTLKGIARPTHAFRILGVSQAASRFEAATEQGLTPLVGREQEIGLLLERWQLAREGQGQVVLLAGEPGIGKSRIVSALRERLEPGVRALRFQCSPYHVNSAFYPSIEHLNRVLRFAREEPAESRLDQLERLVVEQHGRPVADVRFIATILSIECEARYGAVAMTPQKQKEETIRALVDLVEAAARHAPHVMFYEDVHWADPTSLEVLDVLVDRMKSFPLLLLLTHRPEFQTRWSDHGHVSALNLARLARAQSRALVLEVTVGKALPDQLIEQILEKTDGVPLYVEELTRTLIESGELKDTGGRFEYAGSGTDIPIPATLRDSLMARLDRAASVKEIAQIGAAIGREFSYELLSAVAAIPQPALGEGLAQLTASGLAFRRGSIPAASYTFKHALVQDAAYDSMLKAKRIEIHARIAMTLEQHFGEVARTQPERIAHHYSAAGMAERAVSYWHKAGELALQRMAAPDAIAHLQRGLEHLQQLPAGEIRDAHELDLCTGLVTAWVATKGWANDRVITYLDRAWQLQKALDRGEHSLRILWSQWIRHLCIGRVRDSLSWAEIMLSQGEGKNIDDLKLAGHTAFLTTCYFHGQFGSVKKHEKAVLEDYDPVRHRHIADLLTVDPKTYALIYQAFAEWALGYPDKAMKTVEEGIRHARNRGHPFDLAWALQFSAKHFHVYRREPDLCGAKLDEFERLANDQSIGFFRDIVRPTCRAAWLLISDRPAEAEAAFQDSIPIWAGVGLDIDLPYYRTLHAQSALLCGKTELAESLIEAVLEQMARPGWEEKCVYAEALRVKGCIFQLNGDDAAAEGAFRDAIEAARQQQAKSWELRAATSYARLLADKNRRKEAREMLQPIYDWFTEGRWTKDHLDAAALLAELR